MKTIYHETDKNSTPNYLSFLLGSDIITPTNDPKGEISVDIREIPFRIFERFGTRDHHVIRSYSPGRLAGLRIARTISSDWLALHEDDGYVTLKLWRTREKALQDTGFSCFTLFAGAKSTGTWAAGRGEYMTEKVEFNIGDNLEINSTSAIMVTKILQAIPKIGRKDKFEPEGYWSLEKDSLLPQLSEQ